MIRARGHKPTSSSLKLSVGWAYTYSRFHLLLELGETDLGDHAKAVILEPV